MDTITLNMENLSEAEREQLLSLVEKANKPKRFCLENMHDGESYFFIDSDEQIWRKEFFCLSPTDKKRFNLGNAFQTREDAEFELERFKVLHEIKEFISKNDRVGIDWADEDKKKYMLYYMVRDKIIDITSTCGYPSTYKEFYASSREVIAEMIEAIGEERIKKYYFGITE